MSNSFSEILTTQKQKMILLPGVQVLRGLAAIMVFMFHLHYVGVLPIPKIFSFISTHGGLGVELFFVLSAFSLMYSNSVYIKDTHKNWVKTYFLKRVFRIIPLFYVMLIVHLILIFFYFKSSIPISKIIINIIPVFNFIPSEAHGIVWASWSIGVEVVFYSLFPCILSTVLSLRGAVIFWFSAAIVSICSRIMISADQNIAIGYDHYSIASQIGVFSAGILAYFYCQKIENQSEAIKKRTLFFLNIGLIFSTLFLYLYSITSTEFLKSLGRPDQQGWGFIFAGIVVLSVIGNKKWMSNRILQYLGNRGYSIYLTHAVVIALMKNPLRSLYDYFEPYLHGYSYFICAIFALLVTLIISEITYRLVEKRGIDYGKNYIRNMQIKGAGYA